MDDTSMYSSLLIQLRVRLGEEAEREDWASCASTCMSILSLPILCEDSRLSYQKKVALYLVLAED